MDKKILVLVEGKRPDVPLMEHLFNIYKIDIDYEIVSYKTNIYTLYKDMFEEAEPETYDILQVLKAREKEQEKKQIFDEKYTDILLIFDLEPQDSQYTKEKIIKMTEYLVESSDMGKL